MTFSHSKYNPRIKLSPEEMLEISQEINREFAPRFSIWKPEPASQYKLSPKEMFDISEEIRKNYAPRASSIAQELVLLPVDPDHLYAYWNLGDNSLNTTPKIDSGKQLTLRIYAEQNKSTDITRTKSWFDVAIDSTRAQKSVFLSMRAHETAFHAAIGKRFPDNSLAPFAYSNITHVPAGKVIPKQFKESEIAFNTMPQLIAPNRNVTSFTVSSASGQGNH